jgi:DNA polymerase sigma
LSAEIESVIQALDNHHLKLKPYRAKLIEALEKAIKKHSGPNSVELEMYGSVANSLEIENSDIDLRVVGKQFDSENGKIFMQQLERKLRTEKYIKSTKAILTAKVPVIKLVRNKLLST